MFHCNHCVTGPQLGGICRSGTMATGCELGRLARMHDKVTQHPYRRLYLKAVVEIHNHRDYEGVFSSNVVNIYRPAVSRLGSN